MNSTKRKSLLVTLPAWASSLLTAIVSLFLVFIFAGIGFFIGRLLGFSPQELEANSSYGNFVAHLLTGITVAIICYFICKAHPNSWWYTPIVCNAVTLWAGLGNFLIEGNSFVVFIVPFGIGWILSVYTARRGQLPENLILIINFHVPPFATACPGFFVKRQNCFSFVTRS